MKGVGSPSVTLIHAKTEEDVQATGIHLSVSAYQTRLERLVNKKVRFPHTHVHASKINVCSLHSVLSSDKEVATFSGKDFISYQLKSFRSVRPLRQADSELYTTAQNVISLSFASIETVEPSATLLQLGDPDRSTEYAVIEVRELLN